MPGRPDVSVIVPTHDRRHLLGRCLASIVRQTGVSIEIVLVDDGSDDGTVDEFPRVHEANPTVRLLTHRLAENAGQATARNVGISIATGRYLAFLDTDDLFADASTLATMVVRADRERLDLVVSRTEFDDEAVRSSTVGIGTWRAPTDQVLTARAHPDLVLAGSFWACLYDAAFVARIDLRFPEDIVHRDDHPFLLTALLAADRIGAVDRPLVRYSTDEDDAVTRRATRFGLEHYVRRNEVIAEVLAAARRDGRSDDLLELLVAYADIAYLIGVWAPRCLDLAASQDPADADLLDRYLRVVGRLGRHLPAFLDRVEPLLSPADREAVVEGSPDLLRLLIEEAELDAVLAVLAGEELPLAFLAALSGRSPRAEAVVARCLAFHRRFPTVGLESVATGPSDATDAPEDRREASPPRTLVLHVGGMKTGTSALQNVLERNRFRLVAQGVHYPVAHTWRERGDRHLRTAGHVELVRRLANPDTAPAARRALDAELDSLGVPIHTVVLSSENILSTALWHRGQGFADLVTNCGFDDVRVLWVQRAVDDWFVSLYKEYVDNPFTPFTAEAGALLDDLDDEGLLDLDAIERMLTAPAAVREVTIGRHEQIRRDGGIETWFLRHLGIDPSSLMPVDARWQNASATGHQAMLTRLLKLMPGLGQPEVIDEHRAISDLVGTPDRLDWGGLPDALRRLDRDRGADLRRYRTEVGSAPTGDRASTRSVDGGPAVDRAVAEMFDRMTRRRAAAATGGPDPSWLPTALQAIGSGAEAAPRRDRGATDAAEDAWPADVGLVAVAPGRTLVSLALTEGERFESMSVGVLGAAGATAACLVPHVVWDGRATAILDQTSLAIVHRRGDVTHALVLRSDRRDVVVRFRLTSVGSTLHLHPRSWAPGDLQDPVLVHLASMHPEEVRLLVARWFDDAFYLAANPDVEASPFDPLDHYVMHGFAEGRSPRADFSSNAHLRRHPYLRDSGVLPFAHWALGAERRGVVPPGRPGS